MLRVEAVSKQYQQAPKALTIVAVLALVDAEAAYLAFTPSS